MKTQLTKVRSETNITSGFDIPMEFAKGREAKLTGLLINLYSDIVSAVIREYCANAMDSHNKAGQKRPIEVYLPTLHTPSLRIKDHGLGMSLEDITDIYSKYGASTKDMEDESIGSFGLGCKAALSMSPSFTVTAVKDNKKTVAIVSREENALGRVRIVVTMDTMEANGVEISIPTEISASDYRLKAEAVFFTWTENSVLIDGELPEFTMYNKTDFLSLDDKSYLQIKQTHDDNPYPYDGFVVNMGGIGYPVDRAKAAELFALASDASQSKFSLPRNTAWVVTVPLGSIELVPSREGVRWTNKSTKQIVKELSEALVCLVEKVNRSLDSIPDAISVLDSSFAKWAISFEPLAQTKLSWKGIPFPEAIHFQRSLDEEKDVIIPIPKRRSDWRYYDSYHDSFLFGMVEEGNYARGGNYGKKTDTKDSDIKEWLFIDASQGEEVLGDKAIRNVVKQYRNTVESEHLNIVYVRSDLLESHFWLKTLLDDERYDVSSISLSDFLQKVEESKKERAKAAREAAKSKGMQYFTRMPSKHKYHWGKMSIADIESYVKEHPTVEVYVDETLFSGNVNEITEYVADLIPHDAIIVKMDGNKKASVFIKQFDYAVKTDLANAIADSMATVLKDIPLEDYFRMVYSRNNFIDYNSVLALPDGIIKELLKQCSYKKWDKKVKIPAHAVVGTLALFPNLTFPKDSVVAKSRRIVSTLPFLFEDAKPSNFASRSENYHRAMHDYILAHTDTIDNIVNNKGNHE